MIKKLVFVFVMTLLSFQLLHSEDHYIFTLIKEASSDAVIDQIDQGVNIEIVNSNGMSPLMMAVYYQNIDLVKRLIDLGADPYTKNTNGYSAYSIAEGLENEELFSLLKESSIEVKHNEYYQKYKQKKKKPAIFFFEFTIGYEMSFLTSLRDINVVYPFINPDYEMFRCMTGHGMPITWTASTNKKHYFGYLLGINFELGINAYSDAGYNPVGYVDFIFSNMFKYKYGQLDKNNRFILECGFKTVISTSIDRINDETYYTALLGPSILLGIENRRKSSTVEFGVFVTGLFGEVYFSDSNIHSKYKNIQSVEFGFLMRFNYLYTKIIDINKSTSPTDSTTDTSVPDNSQ